MLFKHHSHQYIKCISPLKWTLLQLGLFRHLNFHHYPRFLSCHIYVLLVHTLISNSSLRIMSASLIGWLVDPIGHIALIISSCNSRIGHDVKLPSAKHKCCFIYNILRSPKTFCNKIKPRLELQLAWQPQLTTNLKNK